MEILAAFIAGAVFARLVMPARVSAIDHALERGVQIRNPHPMPAHRPDPPPAPPSKHVEKRAIIDDPTLGPDQVMAINQLDVCRRAREAEGGGWPT